MCEVASELAVLPPLGEEPVLGLGNHGYIPVCNHHHHQSFWAFMETWWHPDKVRKHPINKSKL